MIRDNKLTYGPSNNVALLWWPVPRQKRLFEKNKYFYSLYKNGSKVLPFIKWKRFPLISQLRTSGIHIACSIERLVFISDLKLPSVYAFWRPSLFPSMQRPKFIFFVITRIPVNNFVVENKWLEGNRLINLFYELQLNNIGLLQMFVRFFQSNLYLGNLYFYLLSLSY
jgi:hypothetical protein